MVMEAGNQDDSASGIYIRSLQIILYIQIAVGCLAAWRITITVFCVVTNTDISSVMFPILQPCLSQWQVSCWPVWEHYYSNVE